MERRAAPGDVTGIGSLIAGDLGHLPNLKMIQDLLSLAPAVSASGESSPSSENAALFAAWASSDFFALADIPNDSPPHPVTPDDGPLTAEHSNLAHQHDSSRPVGPHQAVQINYIQNDQTLLTNLDLLFSEPPSSAHGVLAVVAARPADFQPAAQDTATASPTMDNVSPGTPARGPLASPETLLTPVASRRQSASAPPSLAANTSEPPQPVTLTPGDLEVSVSDVSAQEYQTYGDFFTITTNAAQISWSSDPGPLTVHYDVNAVSL
ncbi:MAG: hypothetical protein RIK87_05010, partial [Fuerstiella sp.]